jgi:hypothetical protein
VLPVTIHSMDISVFVSVTTLPETNDKNKCYKTILEAEKVSVFTFVNHYPLAYYKEGAYPGGALG